MNILVEHKVIVTTLMLSPFYWFLTLKERVDLFKQLLKFYGESRDTSIFTQNGT